jgi:hypothetical protein
MALALTPFQSIASIDVVSSVSHCFSVFAFFSHRIDVETKEIRAKISK